MKAMVTSVGIDLHISHSPACTGLHSGFGAEGGGAEEQTEIPKILGGAAQYGIV